MILSLLGTIASPVALVETPVGMIQIPLREPPLSAGQAVLFGTLYRKNEHNIVDACVS